MKAQPRVSSQPPVADLAARLASLTEGRQEAQTAVPGLRIHRADQPSEPSLYAANPCVCLIGQGAKRIWLGEESYVYDAQSYLVISVDLPLTAQIFEASPRKPWLGLNLELEPAVVSDVVAQASLAGAGPRPADGRDSRGLVVSRLTPSLLEPFFRLLSLLETPRDAPVLAPLIIKEICYRLLIGEQGLILRRVAESGGNGRNVAATIGWLKENFRRSVQVEDLAKMAGMSVSSFHKHFRALTAMSPLQFLKKLRLIEARRLMLAERRDAADAAFEVGYESPSQFSREYARLFGAPPSRDVKNLLRSSTD